MAPWQWIILEGERFIMADLKNLVFIHSTGSTDYRDKSQIERLRKKLDLAHVVTLHQVHSANIILAEEWKKGEKREGDGLITATSGLGVGVLTADCLPLLLFTSQVIALLHVGWRGLKEGIVSRAIEYIKSLDNSYTEINTMFGPRIRECCYQVGQDMINELAETLPTEVVEKGIKRRRGGRLFFSLGDAVTSLLKSVGVKGKIYDLYLCTCCSGYFPSYRRKGEAASRFVSLAWKKQG